MATRAYRTVRNSTGIEVHRGDVVTSFRGEPATFVHVSRGGRRVCVVWGEHDLSVAGLTVQEYYPQVFGLSVEEVLCADPN